ncbi:MAG: porin family protein [Bdellovibrionaceae bacterium]|nr:porin family protein [Bdellovibrionales bacterium]MCB9082865.1 porin family protein [Pseudobdellovibrionaceae bacterium]
MKTTKLLIASLCLVMLGVANAQVEEGEVIDAGLQVEPIDVSQEAEQEQPAQPKKVVRVKDGAVASPQQGIVILNQGSQAVPVVQQPTTYVEANPLQDSRADQLRRARQDAEISTEKKIVEKLEESRLEDEKRRANHLFGDRLNTMNAEPQPQAPVPVYTEPQAVQVIQQPMAAPAPQENDEDMKAEIMDAVRTELSEIKKEEKKKPEQRYYLSGAIGMAEYIDVVNVEGNVATGLTFGTEMDTGVVVEAGFHYSNYYIDEYWSYPFFKELDQYNFTIAAKYSLLKGKIRPQIGALAGYTYRKYFDRGYQSFGYSNDSEVTSKSFDLGMIVGLDVDLTDSFAIGVDYRYIMNVTSRTDSEFLTSRFKPLWGDPVEDLDYTLITLNGKFRF